MEPAVYGAIIGSSILMPISVQLINRRRSTFLLYLGTLITVAAIAFSGLIATSTTGLGGIIVVIPIAQLIGCIAIHWAAQSSNRIASEG